MQSVTVNRNLMSAINYGVSFVSNCVHFEEDFDASHEKSTDFDLVEIIPTEEQELVLFDLLKNRRKNISHKETPDFGGHKEFVKNHPYRGWWLVYDSVDASKLLGSVYVSLDNSVGLHLDFDKINFSATYFTNKLKVVMKPLKAQKSKIYKDYFYNAAPNNYEFIDWLTKSGYSESQRSFSVYNFSK